MAFESIACPECRATDGFTKVEPDTYYCPYHKGLFKYVDPSLITVRHEGAFCPCGNRVEFRCQLCGQGCCAECDVIEWQMGAWTPSGHPSLQPSRHPRKLVVPVRDFGYLEPRKVNTRKDSGDARAIAYWKSAERERELGALLSCAPTKDGILVDGRIEDGGAFGLGPILYADDILPQIARGPASGLRHVCRSCLIAGVPATLDAIAKGRECEHPCCGTSPDGECRCCGSSFCPKHFRSSVGRRPEVAKIYTNAGSWGARIWGPEVEGLCAICFAEMVEDAKTGAIEICDSLSGIRRRSFSRKYPGYVVIKPWWQVSDDDQIALRRAAAIGDRAQKAVNARMQQKENDLGPCGRNRLFETPPDIPDLYFTIYKFVPQMG